MHPKTGKVCVPIDPAKAFDFDPETVPTVYSLLDELPKAGSATAAAAEKVGRPAVGAGRHRGRA